MEIIYLGEDEVYTKENAVKMMVLVCTIYVSKSYTESVSSMCNP